MGVLFARVMLVLILFFGVTGGSYALAANSLPDTPLYDAKLALEQVQLQIQTDPADIAGQHLVIARNRIQEIMRLAQAGKVSDDGVMARLENHLNTALHLAAQFGDDGEMQGVLTQAMNMLQEQIQTLTQTQAHVSGESQAQLQITIQLLTQAQNQVELGLKDPNAFRWQFQNSAQIGNPGCSNCSCVDCEPEGDQNQYGSQPEQPGPGQLGGNPDCPSCPCVDCEPEGDQNQEQNQYGPQPEQPGPGQPGGNPDCPSCSCVDCEPEGDQNQYGPQPEQPGPGQPGGNPDCSNCEPEGDQNQYGPQPEQPGPGQPGGNPDCSNCEPEGDQNQYGPQPEQPGPGQPGGNPDCLESLDNVCIPLGTPGPNRPDVLGK